MLQHSENSDWKRYGLAVLTPVVALLIRKALQPLLGDALPFFTVWAGVVLSTWYGGIGPGILTTLLSAVGVWFMFFSGPANLFSRSDLPAELTGMIGFFILSGLITALVENTRKSAKARVDAEIEARRTNALFQTFMDNSPATSYLKDDQGRYVYTNSTNRVRFKLNNPLGKTDYELFPPAMADEYRQHDELVLRENKAHEFIEHTVEADGEHTWLTVKFPVVRDDGARFVGGKSLDITDRKQAEDGLRKAHEDLELKIKERTHQLVQTVAMLKMEVEMRSKTEEQLRKLSARLLRLQDEERRRVARDLHDSTGQTLSALKLSLVALERSISKGVANYPELLSDATALVDQAIQEIRSISYLLHPPLLDEAGFQSAAKWYVEGFGKRSGIEVSLNISEVPLRKELELVLFRVLQESLTNVLRHSGSKTVDVKLTCDDQNAVLSIRDFGSGISPERLSMLSEAGIGVGVGLGGMKQRVSQLGGRLNIESDSTGTLVLATVPIASSKDSSSDESQGTGRAAPAA